MAGPRRPPATGLKRTRRDNARSRGPRPASVVETVASLLTVNPADDSTFRTEVERCATLTTVPAVLEALLRERYPRAIVRERGISDEPIPTLYVYRDGRWVVGGFQTISSSLD